MSHMGDLTPLFDLSNLSHEPAETSFLSGQDVISVDEFDRDRLSYVFQRADEMRALVEKVGYCELLKGRVLACLFYEPSTRTSSSFIAAMERLGGSVIPITQGVQFSSVSKGEALPTRFACWSSMRM